MSVKTVNEKLKKANQKIAGVGGELAFKGFLSKIQLIQSLNYHSVMSEPKDSKKWAIEWIAKTEPMIAKKITSLPEYQFKNLGFLCRIISRGGLLDSEQMKNIDNSFKELLDLADSLKKKDASPPPTTSTATVVPVNNVINYFETMIDTAIRTKKPVTAFELPEATLIEFKASFAFVLQMQADIRANAEYHNENTLINLESTIKAFLLELQKESKKTPAAKPAAKLTAKSLKTPEKLTKLVKYCKTSTLVESIIPSKLVAQRRAFVFDQKSRKMIFFIAQNHDGFSFTGTTMTNIDFVKSVSKIVRKPEEFFKDFSKGVTFDAARAMFDSLTSRTVVLQSGRFNENMVILSSSKSA